MRTTAALLGVGFLLASGLLIPADLIQGAQYFGIGMALIAPALY